jgi:hypothetical protein
MVNHKKATNEQIITTYQKEKSLKKNSYHTWNVSAICSRAITQVRDRNSYAWSQMGSSRVTNYP